VTPGRPAGAGEASSTTDDRAVICEGTYFAIVSDPTHGEFVRCGDEVLVVALTDDGEVLLTVEPSAAFPGQTMILPGGSTETGIAHTDTADHELQEETGYAAGRLDFLGEIRPFSKYLTVRSFVYLARDLAPSRRQGDETYAIGIERVPFAEFESLIAAGRLLDARVIAALYLARAFLAAEHT
jgi:ADP-ribose diphosphatase